MSAKQFAKYLRRRMREKELTITETAKRAQISRGALNKYLNQEVKDGKLSTFVMLGRVLGDHPLTLLSIFFQGWDFAKTVPNRTKSIHLGDDVGFIADIDCPDNYPVAREAIFKKTWELQNVGSVVWENRKLVCIDESLNVSSSKPGLQDHRYTGLTPLKREIEVPYTKPMEHVQLTVHFKSPNYPGTMVSHWKMVDEKGNYYYPDSLGIFCQVQVLAF